MTAKSETLGRRNCFTVRVFLGTRDLVNYHHLRLGFLSLKTFHRQPRRDPVSVEFVLFEFTDIPAVLAVDADKISSRFYYVVDGETYLGWQLQPIVHIFINTSIYRSHCNHLYIPLTCRGTIAKGRAETRDSRSSSIAMIFRIVSIFSFICPKTSRHHFLNRSERSYY